MRIIIVGAGEVGFHLARFFSQEKREVVLIDHDPAKIARIKESLDVEAIFGNGTSQKVLKRAGVERAEIFVAVTNQDEVNIVSCCLADSLATAIKKVARIRNPELANQNGDDLKRLFPIDIGINPDQEGARQLVGILGVPGALELVEYEGGKVWLVSYRVGPESPLVERELSELGSLDPERKVIVVAINRRGKVVIPTGRDVLQTGDIITLTTVPSHLQKLLFLMGRKETRPVDRVIVSGATEAGITLVRTLEGRGIGVKLIEPSMESCEQVAGSFEKAMVLCGDPSDPELLRSEKIQHTQAFIAATRDDEDNILTALLAKRMGARAGMAVLNRSEYVGLATAIGLDGAVSSRIAAANAILRFLRKGKILSVVMMEGEQAEAIEFVALETSDIVSRPLKKLNFPRGALVGAIIREGEVIIPKGDDAIRPGDRVIIFTLRKDIHKIEKILTVKLEYFG